MRCPTGGNVPWRSGLLLLIASWGLTACANGTAGTKGQAQIDAELLLKAETSLPPARSGRLEDLADNHRVCAKRYVSLATRCNALIDEVAPTAPVPPRWWEFWKDGWGNRP